MKPIDWRTKVLEHALRRRTTYALVMAAHLLGMALLVIWGYRVLSACPTESGQTDIARHDVVHIQQSVEMYRVLRRGKCPTHIEELQARGIIAKIPQDPWGRRYYLRCDAGADSIWVASAGPDGWLGTKDDVVSTTPH